MEDKKKDLIPVAAIAIFLVIIIILCVVKLSARNGSQEESTIESGAQAVETLTASDTEEETMTETKQNEVSKRGEKETEATGESLQNPMPSGKEKASAMTAPETRTISGNDPFAGADGVKKTNEEMLMEMAAYWEDDRMDAVEDLANLAWYMKMSAGIVDRNTFYYYGERNDQGQPEGTGIACYAGNEYYYGQWSGGKRNGTGEWVKYYVYYDDDTTSDRAYKLHMYMGEWRDDLPNGEGQEHYDLDMGNAASRDRYIQNVIGTFKDGYYSGEMYLTTLDFEGNQEEWNGLADEGVWSPYAAATNKKEVPVCQEVDDENNYLWLTVKSNQDRGILELLP